MIVLWLSMRQRVCNLTREEVVPLSPVKSQHRTIVDLDSLPAGFDYADPVIGWAELRDSLNDV
jgi:hypothetical protein